MASIPFPVPADLAEDVTDGLNFRPQTVSFSQFQNRAISKSSDFETGATERALIIHKQDQSNLVLVSNSSFPCQGNSYQPACLQPLSCATSRTPPVSSSLFRPALSNLYCSSLLSPSPRRWTTSCNHGRSRCIRKWWLDLTRSYTCHYPPLLTIHRRTRTFPSWQRSIIDLSPNPNSTQSSRCRGFTVRSWIWSWWYFGHCLLVWAGTRAFWDVSFSLFIFIYFGWFHYIVTK